jgi:hypothetical protein
VKILRVWVEQCFKLTREYRREGPMNYTKTAIAETLDSASSEVGRPSGLGWRRLVIWSAEALAVTLVAGMLAIGEFMASMMVSRSCPLPFWPV